MGGSSSTPASAPPRPPSPTFKTPWRQLQWGNTQHDLQYMRDFEPEGDAVKQLRVLLYGPVGAGKSSFINSVSTVVRGTIAHTALPSTTNSEGASFTTKYETHKIRKHSWGSYYPFVFNDIMGVEEGSGRGVRVEDIKLAMMGHVMENYKFNPASSLSPSDSGYNSTPSLDDRAHVLVCVCSGNAANISDSLLQKMRQIREAASDLGIPQLLIVTKLDEACPETERNLQNIYKSKFVKKKMTQLSSELGIPLNCILPVKNYSKETSQDADVDALILNALRLILDFGNDFIDKL
ncbi:interferon-induced protein 44-like [Acanthochromis polyacanthus]|uniref:interferon-induced protein 44-like n=1 Tax=Acanthochromis polyacanthus TaxID=80966 RepID=UPI002234D739|nr:interferon-induced protein 44-like [Acanthochromis polyacanthus]